MTMFLACLFAAFGGFFLRMAIERYQRWRTSKAQRARLADLISLEAEEPAPGPVSFTSEELAELLSPDYT